MGRAELPNRAEPNRALGSDKKLGRAESEHGILLEFADNNGNNHQYLVSTVVYLVINPLFIYSSARLGKMLGSAEVRLIPIDDDQFSFEK